MFEFHKINGYIYTRMVLQKFVIISIESCGMAEESVRQAGRQADRQAGLL
jgi:hypothetical protein